MGLIGPPDDWYTQFRAAGDQLLEYQKEMARFWADLEQAYLRAGVSKEAAAMVVANAAGRLLEKSGL